VLEPNVERPTSKQAGSAYSSQQCSSIITTKCSSVHGSSSSRRLHFNLKLTVLDPTSRQVCPNFQLLVVRESTATTTTSTTTTRVTTSKWCDPDLTISSNSNRIRVSIRNVMTTGTLITFNSGLTMTISMLLLIRLAGTYKY